MVQLEDNAIEKEVDIVLPVDALNILEEMVGEMDEAEFIRVLPLLSSVAEDGRYFSVQIPITGNWLIDMNNNKVSWLGTGLLVQWNQLDKVVIWQSAQEAQPIYIGLDLP